MHHDWRNGGAAVAPSTRQVCCCCSLQVWHVKRWEGPPSDDHCHHAADAEGDHHDEDPCHQRRTVVHLHQFRAPLRAAERCRHAIGEHWRAVQDIPSGPGMHAGLRACHQNRAEGYLWGSLAKHRSSPVDSPNGNSETAGSLKGSKS